MTTAIEHMRSPEFQERLHRDNALIQRIQSGFTPEEPSEENPQPLVTDGKLTEDAAQALGELYLCYEPLVHSVSNDVYEKLGRPPGFNADDLDQEGFYGVFRAALIWQPEQSRGGFLSYARPSIARHVWRRAEEVSTNIRLPVNVREGVRRYRREYWLIYNDNERNPRRRQIAQALGISAVAVDDLANTEAMTVQMGSIHRGYFDDDRDQHSTFSKTREDKWKPIDPAASEAREIEEEILIAEIQKIVNESISPGSETELSDREADILRMRFFGRDGSSMSLDEIGAVFGVPRERIRQIESKTLAKLRHPHKAKKLRDLLTQA